MKKAYKVAIISALVLLTIFLFNILFKDQLNTLKGAIYVVLLPASIALFISYLLFPMERRIQSLVKNKTLSVVLTIVIFFLIVIGVTFLIIYLLVGQIIFVYEKAKANWDIFVSIFDSILPVDTMTFLQNLLSNGQGFQLSMIFDFLGTFGSIFSSIISILLTAIMVPIFLFFILYEKSRIFNGICVVIPEKYKGHARELGKRIDETLVKYFHAKIITILFLSILFSLGFAIVFIINKQIGIPLAILYGIMFGLILAFLDLIPYVGPLIGAILPMLFIAMLSKNTNELILYPSLILGINFLGQWSQKMLIEPLVMSKEVDLHPLLIFTAMLFFGSLFGFVGIILATPICGIIKATSLYIRQLHLKNDDQPGEEADSDGLLNNLENGDI
jgi:putative permease